MHEIKREPLGLALPGKTLLGVSILFLVVVMIRTAWISDDAYITFRVIENFIAGYGPVFNIGQRVQVFTHPLWMFLLSGGYYFLKHFPALNAEPLLLYYATIAASLFLSLLAVILFCWKVASGWPAAVLGVLIFVFSRSFMHYTTSGLENPLSYLLAMVFLWLAVSGRERIFLVALVAGLMILTRQDYLLLFIPYFSWVLISSTNPRRVFLECAAGLAPVFLWEVFSLFYYGFPFPNTAYAKLNTGLDRLDLIRTGLVYFQDLLVRDRITLAAILLAVIMALTSKRKPNRAIGAGILLYLIYILWIGGDFMGGRFFSVPLILAVGLLAGFEGIHLRLHLGGALAAILLGLTVPIPTVVNYPPLVVEDLAEFTFAGQVTDERAYYYSRTGLLSEDKDKYYIRKFYPPPRGLKYDPSKFEVKMLNDLGMKSYSAGPNVHVFDMYALSDPLLARLPSDPNNSVPGHNARSIPVGYVETLWTGENQIEDPAMYSYYSKLELITEGDLWSVERIGEIIRMNLGGYNYLIEDYLTRIQQS